MVSHWQRRKVKGRRSVHYAKKTLQLGAISFPQMGFGALFTNFCKGVHIKIEAVFVCHSVCFII
jgi:hypothetical protein